MRTLDVTSRSPEETRALGALLGKAAEPGMIVSLSGDLGAGKTCFSQGIATGLGVPASTPVTSPSYTLLNTYLGRLPLYHFDLYRLSRVDDLEDLGFDEVAESGGLTLVEWAQRISDGPVASLAVNIETITDEERRLHFEASDDGGARLLQWVAEQLSEGRL